MRIPKLPGVSLRVAIPAALAVLVLLPACSLNVKKNEKGGGEKVDIQTPVGGIHVSQDANARDTGLPTYPGARPKEKTKNDGNNANVNISSGFFGIKVVAIEFTSDDPPEKVAAFYREQLKKYGGVLECHTDNPHEDAGDVDVDLGKDKDDKPKSKQLTCEHNSGKSLELKVGTKDNQHIVSISPQGKGTDFALVYVQAHGSNRDTI